MKILGSSQAVAGFPIVISVSWGLIPSHAPRRAPSLGSRQCTDVVHHPGMGIITVSQWQDREQLQESQVSDVKTTNHGKLLKNNSNHFNNKMYLETLQMGEITI